MRLPPTTVTSRYRDDHRRAAAACVVRCRPRSPSAAAVYTALAAVDSHVFRTRGPTTVCFRRALATHSVVRLIHVVKRFCFPKNRTESKKYFGYFFTTVRTLGLEEKYVLRFPIRANLQAVYVPR